MQKEHYLNYRRVYHGDTTDVFEKRKRMTERLGYSVVAIATTVGPTPFTGLSNAAAVAMASALNRAEPSGKAKFH